MEGIVMNFRRGRRTYRPRHFIIHVDEIDDRTKAKALVGKAVSWKSSSGKIINGKVASAHGNSGALRVIFERGLPGQALTQKVEIK